MKLSLITEVFDAPSLDGVRIKDDGPNTVVYVFSDTMGRYTVELAQSSHETMEFVYRLSSGMTDDQILQLRETVKKYGNVATIYLDSNNGGYHKTKKNNQWFVYGKMIASIMDYIHKNKPIALSFSGISPDMDLVYDRFIKMSKKLDHSNSYSFYAGENYIKDELKQEIMKIKNTDTIGDPGEHAARRKTLATIKNQKNDERYKNIKQDVTSTL